MRSNKWFRKKVGAEAEKTKLIFNKHLFKAKKIKIKIEIQIETIKDTIKIHKKSHLQNQIKRLKSKQPYKTIIITIRKALGARSLTATTSLTPQRKWLRKPLHKMMGRIERLIKAIWLIRIRSVRHAYLILNWKIRSTLILHLRNALSRL